jgi:hypothetical protein
MSLHRSYDSPDSMALWQIELEVQESTDYFQSGGRFTYEEMRRLQRLFELQTERRLAVQQGTLILDTPPGSPSLLVEHYSREDVVSPPYSISSSVVTWNPNITSDDEEEEPEGGSDKDPWKENFNPDTNDYNSLFPFNIRSDAVPFQDVTNYYQLL